MLLTGKAPSTPLPGTPTPATPIHKVIRQHSFTKEKVIVGVRLRPFIAEDSRHAQNDGKKVVSMVTDGEKATVQVLGKQGSILFEFDHGFSNSNDDGSAMANSNQQMVYEKMARPLVQSMISGVNCTFFAYGQTGTGKTFSTLGTNTDPGVVPRFCRDLIERMGSDVEGDGSWTLEISYFEIYNENIIDLFGSKRDGKKTLRVREHPEDGPFVDNLASIAVSNYDEIEKWLQVGNTARHKASTVRNDGSSRSHAVFSLKLMQMTVSGHAWALRDFKLQRDGGGGGYSRVHGLSLQTVNGRPFVRKSKANFVDLAGSERLDSTSSSMSNADRMAETRNINKSLAHLGNVILQLANGSRGFISYRDSVLTW